jgi:putative SOS response-associated peptidase YedK
MFYKLSNSSELETIEEEFSRKHNFPNLYKSKTILNGLKEVTVSIITAQDPDQINHAIWGLLPKGFDDDWKSYQSVDNTLNINLDKVDASDELYYNALTTNRCIVITSGFFTSRLHEGKLFPYHVHLKDHRPFGIAGVYNMLEDGFITCSILVTKANRAFENIPNLSKNKPLVFKNGDFSKWLDTSKSYQDQMPLIQNHETLEFLSYPIKEEFYRDSGVYDTIIQSAGYYDILRTS